MIQSIIFILVLLAVGYFSYPRYKTIAQNIHRSREYRVVGSPVARLKQMLLIAFGQKKMFKRPIPAIFHAFIYVAFLFTQIELIEIIIDGVFGSHRIFAPVLGMLYTFIINMIEVLSLLALVATFIFLWRRNKLKVPRLVQSELNGWPKLDANLILVGELLLLIGIFSMNGADKALQNLGNPHYPELGTLFFSSHITGPIFSLFSEPTLISIERFGWWLHILVVFSFIAYLPFSKHLHIFLAFPNTYFTSIKPRGEMENMPVIMNEVKSMMGMSSEVESAPINAEEMPSFGASDVHDLTWKNLLDAYSCTECGRCTAVCPANITGKKLSPRKIMMDVRDRAEEVGRNIKTKSENTGDRNLFSYTSKEEIDACTTCNACVEACPILIDPLDIILQLRRYQILTESAGPAEWTPMFTSLENQGSVWQMTEDREAWMR